jgi:hypothetical protein
MIVLLDHIALTPRNLNEGVSVLSTLGYKARFKRMGVSELAIKREMTTLRYGRQDLLLFDSEGNTSLEIVNYGRANETEPYVLPIVEGIDASRFERVCERSIGDLCVTEYTLLDSDYHVLIGAGEGGVLSLKGAAIMVSELSASVGFWETFGLRLCAEGSDYAVMECKFPLNQFRFRIYLRESKEAAGEYHLDDMGFNCIAFVSNSVKLERELLDRHGCRTTEIETFRLNDRDYNIMFAVGPSGEMVELLSVQRGG